jgi:hypothetical protein
MKMQQKTPITRFLRPNYTFEESPEPETSEVHLDKFDAVYRDY